jgi:hypothetical protein
MYRLPATRWLREPLLHFAVVGALLFALNAWLNRDSEPDRPVVHVSMAEVEQLKASWAPRLQAPLDEAQVRNLVGNYIFEKLLAMEARTQGLDDNDPVIQKHLAEKMEFLTKDTRHPGTPSDENLRRLYDEERDRFQLPRRITFEQLVFASEATAQKWIVSMTAEGTPDSDHPPLMRSRLLELDQQALAQQFGQDYAKALFSAEPGSSLGPFPSQIGFVVALVEKFDSARTVPFDEALPQLRETWQTREQNRLTQEYFDGLFDRYEVVMDDSVDRLMGSNWRADP